jgi:hypothetical protein
MSKPRPGANERVGEMVGHLVWLEARVAYLQRLNDDMRSRCTALRQDIESERAAVIQRKKARKA